MKNLFEKYYGASESCLKTIMKPFNKKRLRRMAESYYDSCVQEQVSLAETVIKSITKIEDWDWDDFQKIVESRVEFDRWGEQATKCREIYKEIFNEELPEDDISIEDLLPEVDCDKKKK